MIPYAQIQSWTLSTHSFTHSFTHSLFHWGVHWQFACFLWILDKAWLVWTLYGYNFRSCLIARHSVALDIPSSSERTCRVFRGVKFTDARIACRFSSVRTVTKRRLFFRWSVISPVSAKFSTARRMSFREGISRGEHLNNFLHSRCAPTTDWFLWKSCTYKIFLCFLLNTSILTNEHIKRNVQHLVSTCRENRSLSQLPEEYSLITFVSQSMKHPVIYWINRYIASYKILLSAGD